MKTKLPQIIPINLSTFPKIHEHFTYQTHVIEYLWSWLYRHVGQQNRPRTKLQTPGHFN